MFFLHGDKCIMIYNVKENLFIEWVIILLFSVN
jgi:hypothetical protein